MRAKRPVSLLSRALLAGIFISAGIAKFKDREGTTGYMKSKNLPAIPVTLPLAAAAEIVGGVSILLGIKRRFVAGALASYLVPTSLVFHDFWKFEGQERQMQMVNFMKNLAIIGGLLSLISEGGAELSLDSVLGAPHTEYGTEEELKAA